MTTISLAGIAATRPLLVINFSVRRPYCSRAPLIAMRIGMGSSCTRLGGRERMLQLRIKQKSR